MIASKHLPAKHILALAVLAFFGGHAIAAQPSKVEAKTEASTVSEPAGQESKPVNTVDYSQLSLSSKSDVQRSFELTGESSLSKLEKIATERDIDRKEIKLKAVKADDELEQQQFLLKNVPPEIRLLGDKQVKAFLQSKFVDKPDVKPVEPKSTETIWKSDPATLAALTPVIPTPSLQTASIAPTNANAAVKQTDNEAALAALGLTPDELKASAPQKKPGKKEKGAKKTSSHSIGDIKWNRVVIMGKVARADLTVDVVTPEGKKIPQNINGIEAGSYFTIAEREYLVDSITSDAVVFTDLKDKKTHRVSVR